MATILIVDDDAVIRGILFDLLSETHECNTASTADQALQYLEIEKYDVVITDVAMSGLSGVELLKRVQLKDLQTPVIVISGKQNEEGPESLLKLGAFAFISKPFKLDEVESLVERAVSSNVRSC